MRYGIFSDIHSNIEALDAVFEAYKKEAIDKYLCVGDVVGYASNPNECIDRVKFLAKAQVAGNHDRAAVNLFSVDYFNPFAREAISWTSRNLNDNSRYFLESLKLLYKNEDLTLVHGTLVNPEEFDYMTDVEVARETFEILEANICFVGHTHIAGIFIRHNDGYIHYQKGGAIELKPGNKYIVDVGSVGQPRDNNPKAAYCIFDTENKKVHIKRTGYNKEGARKKIINVGLPKLLGDRLLVGR